MTDEPLKDDEVSGTSEAVVEEEDGMPDETLGIKLNTAPDDGVKRRWYAIHAHSGQEANVQSMLISGAEQLGLSDLITNALVPMEDNSEPRPGTKVPSSRKCYPGYVLLQLPEHPENYAELWHLIKETPGVTGFIGSRTLPIPLEDSEIAEIVWYEMSPISSGLLVVRSGLIFTMSSPRFIERYRQFIP
ncbi:MAG: hypothetical protein L3K26_17190 [Candidatus Hydrogenedentes bacterium]|nr:hypothetical protein [Candidatus Hydrogenedentota bacterium]